MTHVCTQAEIIASLKKDFDEHRTAQQEQDKARELNRERQREHDKAVDNKLENISVSIKDLIELNKEVKDMKTAWRVSKNIGVGLALFIGVIGTISGGIYALKNWIKS